MNMKRKTKRVTIACLLIGFMACTKVEDKTAATLAPILNNESYLVVEYTNPGSGAIDVATNQFIDIKFNKAINDQRCIGAFTITPFVVGLFSVYDSLLEFQPDGGLTTGTYVVEISKDCEDLENRDLHTEYTFSFAVQ